MVIKLFVVLTIFNIFHNELNYEYMDNHIEVNVNHFEDEYRKYNYFKNESIEEIAKKLNRELNSTLKNKGEFIARYSIQKGVDPYLAAAVILQETGCKWTCSKLVRTCNNVGGNKGKPSCNGGSYRRFDTIEDGIKYSIRVLSNYYRAGKTTPEKIGPKYASDPNWAKRVNNYMKRLKK